MSLEEHNFPKRYQTLTKSSHNKKRHNGTSSNAITYHHKVEEDVVAANQNGRNNAAANHNRRNISNIAGAAAIVTSELAASALLQNQSKPVFSAKTATSHGKVGVLADMHQRERDISSSTGDLVMTLGMGALILAFSVSIVVSLVMYCKKRNSIYAMRAVKRPEDEFDEELEDIGSDFASTCTDPNGRADDDSCDDNNDGCVVYYNVESSAKGFSKTGASEGCKTAVVYYPAGSRHNSVLQSFMNSASLSYNNSTSSRLYRSLSGNHLVTNHKRPAATATSSCTHKNNDCSQNVGARSSRRFDAKRTTNCETVTVDEHSL